MRAVAATLGLLALGLGAAILLLRLLFPLPSLEGRTESAAIPASEATALGARLLPEAAAHPGLSGVYPLADGREAFSIRVLLARRAQASIDAQYYIWQDDATGRLLLDELRAAALRGVRVRLLLDDNGIGGLDEQVAGLDAMEGVEVRLWNPFTLRRPKALSYLFDFPRLNRRMHNKSFTADGVATVVGGRNVGDVYFAYGAGGHYVDMDVLAAGPAAEAVAADFDRYWSSRSAYLAGSVLPPAPGGLALIEEAAAAARAAPETAAFADSIAATPLMRRIEARDDVLDWVPALLLSDDPAKGLGEAGRAGMLLTRLLAEVGEPARSLDVVSAYFVPGRDGTGALAGLEARGVAVRVMTNAWEAADVPLVHAGYLRWRPELLAAGVGLLELRAEAAPPPASDGVDLAALGSLGSSAASLHAKTMSCDRERAFVGSFNFDPRSGRLNTEMGLLIDSPAIAGRVSAMMDEAAPGAAYRVEREASGALAWVAGEGEEARLAPEPGTTALTRLALRAVGLLPIEWLL